MKNILTVIGGILIISVFSVVYSDYKSKKIGYVNSQELIYEYSGTKEAMVKFNKKKSDWQSNVDTLKIDFQRAVDQFNRDFKNLSNEERNKRAEDLTRRENQLKSYSVAISEKIEVEDQKLMQEVLDQVNVLIEEYARKNNYDLILGTTDAGSILYGDDQLDITSDILEELNQKYAGNE
ncbi:OmpH family outer membrane protein [Fulvivirga sp.]|uniref:OmpH family outer membrane protein n=1 Tax=Fulvivirga sp. TaxID=1931237 RepID=UPI0032EB523E